MIGNDSVLLDLVDDSFSTSPSDEGSGGGGGGCFIAATSLDFTATTGLWVRVTIIFCSVIIIGSASSGRRKKRRNNWN